MMSEMHSKTLLLPPPPTTNKQQKTTRKEFWTFFINLLESRQPFEYAVAPLCVATKYFTHKS